MDGLLTIFMLSKKGLPAAKRLARKALLLVFLAMFENGLQRRAVEAFH
ncbi:hypothetical protein SAMN03159358_2629 [Paenibacillus sp. NFR01]|nr:hypothetical protein SAMN03159358_2629 [Paenibacillus sp. NFR01]